jgi:hypothetical protein
MSVKHLVSTVAAALVLLLAMRTAAGDTLVVQESLKFLTPATCTTEGGSTVNLSPGRYVVESTWLGLERQAVEDENLITKLIAENEHLKDSEPMIGWKTATAALIVGILVGAYALDR